MAPQVGGCEFLGFDIFLVDPTSKTKALKMHRKLIIFRSKNDGLKCIIIIITNIESSIIGVDLIYF